MHARPLTRHTLRRLAVVGAAGVVLAAAAATGPVSAAGSNDAPKASILQLTGTSTSVDIDPSTAAVLAQNGVTVAPVAPATASTNGGTTTVSFPISEGYVSVYDQSQAPFVRGTFTHVGGVTFSAGGKSLTATDFVVNPGSSSLTATVGGNAVQLLDLDGTNVKITQDGDTTKLDGTVAKLSATAAGAMNSTFGVSLFKAGIPLGVVHVAARGTTATNDVPKAEIQQLGGSATSVDLDPSTAAVLQQNGVALAPVAPATASVTGGTTTVSFPIDEGYVSVYDQSQTPFVRGTFSHVGGVTFSAGGKSLTATDFMVNPGSSSLTATVGGNAVPVFDLDGTNVKITQEGSTTRLDGTVAKLSSAAAGALNETFGVSVFKQGIPIGVVHVAAIAGPPPAQVGNATAPAPATPSTTTPAAASGSGTPTGAVAAGGGGTAGGTGSTSTLPAAGVALALLVAAGWSLWRHRTVAVGAGR